MIMLKVTKNQGFSLSLEDTFFEKPQGGSNWPRPSRSRVKINEITINVAKKLDPFSNLKSAGN